MFTLSNYLLKWYWILSMVNLTDCMMHVLKVDSQACGQGIHFLCGTQTFVLFKGPTVSLY